MKLLLDVDGVVADFIGSLLETINSKLQPSDIKEWGFLEILPSDERAKAEAVLKKPSFWRNLPLLDGAKEGVQELRDRGFEITWLTSPWESCPGWDRARTEWVHHHFDERDPVIVRKDKEKVDGDVFIDDKPDNIEKWQKAHPNKKAFIFDAPYNQKCMAPRMDWKGAIKNL